MKENKTNRTKMKVVAGTRETEGTEECKAPLMLTIDETAKKAHLSSYTVRSWVKSGMVKSVKIGHKYLVPWNVFCGFLCGECYEGERR